MFQKCSNLGKRLKFYEMTSVDNIYTTEYSIGFGIINNTAYLAINILWVALEFSVNDVSIKVRKKYGSNIWGDWAKIS